MWNRIGALVLRHLYLYRRSPTRIGEVLFWPVMELLLWGFFTVYLRELKAPSALLFLIGSMIFWDVLYRSQQGITISISEEIWVRNILNLFIAPVRIVELMIATCLVGVLKAAATAVVLGFLAFFFYHFSLLSIGPALIPFFVSLSLFGWAVGMCTMGLVLRFGQAAEALIWGVPFLLQPISAVFYPVEVLPRWLRPVALLLPSTHVFEGMRAALRTGRVDPGALALTFGMNLVYLALGATFFGWMLRQVRRKGYLSRLGME
jgi:ABC-2 type transport system permease protein